MSGLVCRIIGVLSPVVEQGCEEISKAIDKVMEKKEPETEGKCYVWKGHVNHIIYDEHPYVVSKDEYVCHCGKNPLVQYSGGNADVSGQPEWVKTNSTCVLRW